MPDSWPQFPSEARNAEALAREFWAGTGLSDTFPRPVERAVGMKLPLTIIKWPAVAVEPIRLWLARVGIAAGVPSGSADLMGCLFAHHGRGFAFVCGADPEDEQRLTVAHEVAHFLRDYLAPRQQVIAALGSRAADVLDGRRRPAIRERAAALLAHVRLGPHVHLLPRPGAGPAGDAAVAWAEARADALAVELTAPRDRLLGRLRRHPAFPRGDAAAPPEAFDAIRADLAACFGLPPQVFEPVVRAALRPRCSPVLIGARAAVRGARPPKTELP